MVKLLTYDLRKNLLSTTLFLTFWSGIHIMAVHRFGHSWRVAAMDSLVSNSVILLISLGIATLYNFYKPGDNSRIYQLLFAILMSGLCAATYRFLLKFTFSDNAPYLEFIERSMPVRGPVTFLIISFVTVINWLLITIQEQEQREKKKATADQLLKEAELARLRQQLQPHFLFNSLNSISALSLSRPEEARQMIQQLSDFLRATLRKDDQTAIPLSEEMEQLQLYLGIERVRFGHRLNVEIETAEDAKNCLLPPLLLQPIVENAIKFGLYGTTDDMTVGISVKKVNQVLVIRVENPFDDTTQSSAAGTGFGLGSVQKRLLLIYNRNDLLTTEVTGNHFVTVLKIPQT